MAKGSIPAYAGDPRATHILTAHKKVYPRLRGGSRIERVNGLPFAGLSPPTRGIRGIAPKGCGFGRSIPAYAGDPLASTRSYALRRVYPRLRGGS